MKRSGYSCDWETVKICRYHRLNTGAETNCGKILGVINWWQQGNPREQIPTDGKQNKTEGIKEPTINTKYNDPTMQILVLSYY